MFRIGPWFCYQCERKTLFLPRPKRNFPTFNRSVARGEYRSRPTKFTAVDSASKSRSSFKSSPANATDASKPSAEPVGNFLKTDSLVMQDKRSKRFTPKYRDAAVEKLLSGSTSIAQMCKEHNIGEKDIVGWINDLVTRKSAKIAQLTNMFQLIQKELPPDLKEAIGSIDASDLAPTNSSVVEGKILPR